MSARPHCAADGNVAGLHFHDKSADGVMSCSRYDAGAWRTTQIVTGRGRELSAAWSNGGKRTLAWFDTASSGLLVHDV